MVAELQKHGYVNNFEARFKKKDNRLVDGLISARVITLSDEPHILAVSRDISDLKITEKTLLASRSFLQISNRHTEMNPLLKEFIAQIKLLTGCSAVGMRVLDENGNIPYLRCMCSDVVLGKVKIKPDLVTEAGSFCVGSTSYLMTTLSEADKSQICDVCGTFGYESVALIPIRLADRILGLIHLADARMHMFAPETIAILERTAMQLAVGIERIHTREALQKSHRELERRVQERTAQLVSANELLNLEIEERKFTEKKLMEQQDKLRSLSSELQLTEERERRRLATDLHDRIGQNLAVTNIKLGELRETLASNKASAAALDDIRGFIEQTIQDTRSLTFELSPPVLYELGLEAALAWLADRIREKHGLRVEFKDDGQPKPLDNGCRVIAFQAARELMFNTVKHARAKKATLSIRRDEDAIRIDIEDDGIGFDSSEIEAGETVSGGFGLFSIRERLSPLGGHLEIKSEPGRGTRASLVVPLVCDTQDAGE
jgi:signal transduction histidine kinase